MPYSVVSVGQPALGAVPEDAVAKPHHVKARNGQTTCFQNPTPSGAKSIANWQIPLRLIKGHIDGSLRLPWPAQDEEIVAVQTPSFLPTRFASPDQLLRTTWLGHACHYIEFPSGLRVLVDPVLEDRCSPFTFLGPRRYTRRACPIADLPFLDAVIISHSHYDHLSLPTVREIARLFPGVHFFVGLGLASWFRASGVENVTEMDWWEDVEVEVAFGGEGDGDTKQAAQQRQSCRATATISCLPAQHTSSRYGYDQNKTLWCSWAIRSASKSVFFGGDTGYRAVPVLSAGETEDDYHLSEKYAHLPHNPSFAQIGELRGPFDVGLIPIGAYQPRFLFSWMHADPFDAVDIFRDTRCERALGIHWGTWALTSEPVMEPPERLKMALKRRGVAETGVFDVCEIGESRIF